MGALCGSTQFERIPESIETNPTSSTSDECIENCGYIWVKHEEIPSNHYNGFLNPIMLNQAEFILIPRHIQDSERMTTTISAPVYNIITDAWSEKKFDATPNDYDDYKERCLALMKISPTNPSIQIISTYQSDNKHYLESHEYNTDSQPNHQYEAITIPKSPFKLLAIDGVIHIFQGKPAVHSKWDISCSPTEVHRLEGIINVSDYEFIYVSDREVILILGYNTNTKQGEIFKYSLKTGSCQLSNVHVPKAACIQIQNVAICDKGRFMVIFRGRGLFIFDIEKESFLMIETWDYPSSPTNRVNCVTVDYTKKLLMMINLFMRKSELTDKQQSTDNIRNLICDYHGRDYIHLIKPNNQHWMVHFADLLRDHSQHRW